MSDPTVESAAADPHPDPQAAGLHAVGLAGVPQFTRSLLRVSVPVSVQLASKKESVREIVEMAPGSILTFEKGCDQKLQLAVGTQIIADGEAVKIGDKFGFRVHEMVMPDEQFSSVRPSAAAEESTSPPPDAEIPPDPPPA